MHAHIARSAIFKFSYVYLRMQGSHTKNTKIAPYENNPLYSIICCIQTCRQIQYFLSCYASSSPAITGKYTHHSCNWNWVYVTLTQCRLTLFTPHTGCVHNSLNGAAFTLTSFNIPTHNRHPHCSCAHTHHCHTQCHFLWPPFSIRPHSSSDHSLRSCKTRQWSWYCF